MNCKPGDLAVICQAKAPLAGRVVQVLKAAPIGTDFLLPDGVVQRAQSYEWVCFFPTPIDVPMQIGGHRLTHYACVPDWRLRPLGGVPVHDEEHDEVASMSAFAAEHAEIGVAIHRTPDCLTANRL